jgi:hypothetical protein
MIVLLWLACAPDPSGAPGPTSDDSTTGPSDDSATLLVDADADGWAVADDCDDADPAVNPAADEVCNGIDDDCDGRIDADALDAVTRFEDDDGDGYGVASFVTCDETAGAAAGGDCDDALATAHPGACEEPIDGHDDDCDGIGDLEIPIEQTATNLNGDWDEFQAAETGPVALRIIGTVINNPYDTRQVHFLATKPTILVLWSVNEVKWVVDEAVPGTLQEVIVTSPSPEASAVVPKDVPTDRYLGANQLFTDNPWYWADPETRNIEAVLEDLTGIDVTSWAFAYGFEEVTIADAKAWPEIAFEYPSRACAADDTPFDEPDTTIFPDACDWLLEKGPVCLTTGGDGTLLFDAEGNNCEILPTGIEPYSSYVSIGWRNDYLYGVEEEWGQVVRLRLSDGHVDRSYRYADGVTDLDDQVLVYDQYDRTMIPFESWAAIVDSVDPKPRFDHVFESNIATWGGFYWTAHFVDHAIDKMSTAVLYAHLGTIQLEDYDDYIGGFDFTDEDRILVRGRLHFGTDMHVFDMLGTAETVFDLPVETGGVSCFTAP